MSASVCVESGISAGTSYWIDRAVLRIGSDPQCDLCLPSAELRPHTLTLEFRDGTYRVYNRSTSPVTVDETIVQPGASAIWRAESTIRLAGDLRLALKIDGDPRPAPLPDSHRDGSFADDVRPLNEDTVATTTDGDVTSKKSSSKSLIQLAVIGFCVLAMVGLLMMRNSGGEPAAAPDMPSFSELVNESLTKDETHRAIIRRLQYAQAAFIRGNSELARERFLKLRDDLVSHVDSLQANERSDTQRILSYVEYRLGQI